MSADAIDLCASEGHHPAAMTKVQGRLEVPGRRGMASMICGSPPSSTPTSLRRRARGAQRSPLQGADTRTLFKDEAPSGDKPSGGSTRRRSSRVASRGDAHGHGDERGPVDKIPDNQGSSSSLRVASPIVSPSAGSPRLRPGVSARHSSPRNHADNNNRVPFKESQPSALEAVEPAASSAKRRRSSRVAPRSDDVGSGEIGQSPSLPASATAAADDRKQNRKRLRSTGKETHSPSKTESQSAHQPDEIGHVPKRRSRNIATSSSSRNESGGDGAGQNALRLGLGAAQPITTGAVAIPSVSQSPPHPEQMLPTMSAVESLTEHREECAPSNDAQKMDIQFDVAVLSPELEAYREKSERRKSSRRESKRRSSFVRGRILQKVTPMADHELMAHVPADLPEEDRLAQLTKLTFEFTLNKLQDEFHELDYFQSLNVEAREAVQQGVETLKKGGSFKKATARGRFLTNPGNKFMQESVEELESYTKRLDGESAAWDKLVEDTKAKASKALSNLEEVDSHPIRERPKGIGADMRTLLDRGPDYNGMSRQLQILKEQSFLSQRKTASMMRTLKHFTRTSGTVVGELQRILHRQSFGGMQDLTDPRRLLEHIQKSQSLAD